MMEERIPFFASGMGSTTRSACPARAPRSARSRLSVFEELLLEEVESAEVGLHV